MIDSEWRDVWKKMFQIKENRQEKQYWGGRRSIIIIPIIANTH